MLILGIDDHGLNLNNFEELFYGSELSFTRKGCAASQIIHPNGTAFIIIIGPNDSSEILNTENIFGEWMAGMIEIIYFIRQGLDFENVGEKCETWVLCKRPSFKPNMSKLICVVTEAILLFILRTIKKESLIICYRTNIAS